MPSKAARTIALIVFVLLASACSGGDIQDADQSTSAAEPHSNATEPAIPETPADQAALKASNELVSNCLNFPAEEITVANSIRPTVGVTEGQPAVDFSLMGSDGHYYTLSELLSTKPVLVVLGGFT
jgi:hypothetical protein